MDVALVVVHGIGEQARGTTLLAWAEPLTRRLDMIAREGGGGVRVARSRLLEGDAPSEIELAVDLGHGVVRRMVFSEARWAESFLTVTSTEVLRWGLSFLRRAITRFVPHVARSWSTNWALFRERAAQVLLLREAPGFGAIPNGALGVLALALTVLLVPSIGLALLGVGLLLGAGLVVVVLVAAGGLAVALRIPVLGRAVRGVATGLVTSVGDATAWTRHPILAAAMRDRVRDELVRARGRARTVVLLGHSQGAAVSADVVLYPQEGDPTADVLVTVGGAVGLLGRSTWSPEPTPDLGPVAVWAGRPDLEWINIWAGWDPVPSGPMADSRYAGKQRWRQAYVESYLERRRQTDLLRSWIERGRRSLTGWIRTTLPGGGTEVGWSLSDGFPVAPALGPEEWQVHNRASIATDHVTYTANIPQVIEPIARVLLDGRMGSWARRTGQHSRLAATAATHVNAVRILGTTRLAAAGAAVVLTLMVSSAVATVPLLSWLTRALRPLDERVSTVVGWLTGQSWQAEAQIVFTGVVIYVLLLIAASVLFGLWTRSLAWKGRFEPCWALSAFAFLVLVTGVPTAYGAQLVARMLPADWATWWVWALGVLVLLTVCGLPLGGLRPALVPPRRVSPDPAA